MAWWGIDPSSYQLSGRVVKQLHHVADCQTIYLSLFSHEDSHAKAFARLTCADVPTVYNVTLKILTYTPCPVFVVFEAFVFEVLVCNGCLSFRALGLLPVPDWPSIRRRFRGLITKRS